MNPDLPAQGAAVSTRARARLVYDQVAQQVAECARGLVATAADELVAPGEYTKCAQRLKAYVMALSGAAVYLDRASGATWEQIAATRHQDVASLMEDFPDAADASAIREWADRMLDASPEETAAKLDAWYAATASPREGRMPPRRAVSGGLY